MKKLLVAVFAVCVVLSAVAADYTFVSTASDANWSDKSNYRDSSGNEPKDLPGAEDTVTAPAATYAITVPSASFTAFSGLKRVIPSKTTFSFTVASGEYTNGCAITSGKTVGTSNKDGKIEKLGAGSLVLAADKVLANGTSYYDYNVDISVEEGTLKLPQYSSGQSLYYGRIYVNEGATLYTTSQKPGGSTSFSYLRQLTGAGTVKNEPNNPGRTGHSMAVSGNGAEASVFSGTIEPQITLYNQSGGGELTLLGTNSTFNGAYIVSGTLLPGQTYPTTWPNGVVSFVTIGDKNAKGSSLGNPTGGYNGSSTSTNATTVFRYLGVGGETAPRKFNLQSAGVFYFDAGANGGITFTGDWEASNQAGAEFYRIRRVVLLGSNTTECVMKGDFVPHSVKPSAGKPDTNDWLTTVFPVFVTKRGTGAWRMADRTSAKGAGGYAIEEGTLRFDSIAEKGNPCSLGLATMLTACSPYALLSNSVNYVDYAYTLGNPNDAAVVPVFEYAGTKSASCSTRPIALVGGGGELRNATDKTFAFSGVSARDAGTNPTLYLGGDNTTADNHIENVTDGAKDAKVNLVKTGAGTWTLGEGNAFTGDLAVRNGTLAVSGNNYTWFRFTVKAVPGWEHTKAADGSNFGITIGQIALYDKNGVRQNAGLTQPFDPATYPYWNATFSRDPFTIPAGQAEFDCGYGAPANPTYFYKGSVMGGQGAYDITKYPQTYSFRLDSIFDDVGTTSGWFLMSYRNSNSFKTGDDTAVPTQRMPKLDNPNSWIAIVMHLASGSKEIASYDICSGKLDEIGRWPVKFTLEGSRDGQTWTLLDDKTDDKTDFATTMAGKTSCWYSDGAAFASGAVRTGFPINGKDASFTPMDLGALRSVAVSTGAKLAANGPGLEISALKFDAAGGSGIFKGFTLAEEGTVEVVNATDAYDQVLPVTFEDCEGTENLSGWTVKSVNGRRRACDLEWRNGELHLLRRGMMLLVR